MSRLCFFLLAISMLSPCLYGQEEHQEALNVSSHTTDIIQSIVGDTYIHGQAYEYERQLTDEIGPRITGSTNYMAAVKWGEERMRDLDLVNVHTETFSLDTWEPNGPATGNITGPFAHELHVHSFPGSPSTPTTGIAGKVVHVPGTTTAQLMSVRESLHGNLALLDHDSLPANITFAELVQAINTVEGFGVKGLVVGDVLPAFLGHTENGIEDPFTSTADGTTLTVPAVQIGSEDVHLIHRLMEKSEVTISFSFSTKIRKHIDVPQVIGEIRGTQYPDDVVLVGAHLDSWHPGTGAQDNGTGVATVLDVARTIQAQHHAPRRTVRFVLFGGEEQAMRGSAAYVLRHREELAKIDAVLFSDTGSGPVYGWYSLGRDDQKEALQKIRLLLSNVGSDQVNGSSDFLLDGDHAPFLGFGVPSLLLWTDISGYGTVHHKASDTLESISRQNLMQAVTTIAVTVYAIADNENKFARHLSPDEVQKQCAKAGQESDCKFFQTVGILP